MINTPEKYVGMSVKKARKEIVNDLKVAGKIKKIETIHHTIGVCYRDKVLIEPRVSKQWFLKVKPLAQKALVAINSGEVKFVVKRYEKIAKHWLKNLRDWNISRQVVWGIRIPAFRCEKCLEWIITDGKKPKKCSSCNHNKLTQDPDTFDTWFSSSQWPYATLKTTKRNDFEYFYPTSVMNTGYDIIPFWIIRMIMLGLYATGKVPFKKVLIHGLIRDKKGKKISKSKGNVVNPIEMVEKYGADALRMALIWGALIENDIALSEDNIKGQRNFANKIWNVARFIFMEPPAKRTNKLRAPRTKNGDDKKIIKELRSTVRKATRLLDKYRLNEAAKELYDFFWNKFANDYLEKTKKRRIEAQKTLEYVLQESLKLLHPFMPYVTETIWQEEKDRFDSPILITAPWPKG
jgi:valyl-tRNA synthetase